MPSDQQIKLERVRLSFPDIWKPKAVKKEDEPKYSAAFLIEKTEKEKEGKWDKEGQVSSFKLAVLTVAKEEWGDKAKEMIQKGVSHPKGGKDVILTCLHEGSDKEYDGYNESNMYISSSSPRRPMVRDRDLAVLAEEDRRPYAGCYVNAIVRLWNQKNNFGNRVNAELMGLQFVADGEPFGAAPLADDAFENLDEKEGKTGKTGKKKDADMPGDPNTGIDDDEIPF